MLDRGRRAPRTVAGFAVPHGETDQIRVELVRPKVISEARTTAMPFADIDYVSVKPYMLVWSDLVIVPKSGAAIRLRPLIQSDAHHVEDLINRQLKKPQL